VYRLVERTPSSHLKVKSIPEKGLTYQFNDNLDIDAMVIPEAR